MDSDEILVSLRRIMHRIDLHSKQLQRTSGLTVPQLLILHSVARAGSLPVSAIAREVSLSQGTVTSVLDRLEKRGYLVRRRDSPDRRVVTVSLTGAGKQAVEEAPGLLQEDFVDRYDRLPDWEQKMLAAAVERIASLMDAETMDAAPILEAGTIDPAADPPDASA
ncbi:MarR family winged helix-turn-helix transcriptional regulator [Elongatibacter sediminis]|uniref:MarR family transcriptional regulator n=1 Tax=Elongatibacter sediminis TaxID=3119006 RepID=A0AAW9RCF5_9GAMM